MDKIQRIISELTPDERQRMLVDLLIPYCKTLQGEVCVLDEDDKEVIGWVMSAERREDMIRAELLEELPIDRSKCRPKAEFMKELRAKLAANEAKVRWPVLWSILRRRRSMNSRHSS